MNGDRAHTSGQPFPLGATLTTDGTNFAVVADGELSTAGESPLDLCLVDESGAEHRVPMQQRTSGIWHAFVPGVAEGQRYGYRVSTRDAAKLLLDPYARRVDRTDYELAAASTPGADTLGHAPLGIVTARTTAATPGPNVPWEHTVIYEAHVKGLTKNHPGIPPHLRGTYAGLAHPAMLQHLTSLGVTTVELLPIHAHADEPLLARAGRPNYWGYSTLSYFAIHPGYAATPGGEMAEFAQMVDALHSAGLELMLDVVYNHTCEGGPSDAITLSWRGLANEYYLPMTQDLTGTGNTLDPAPLTSVRLVTDSLRYFATEFGVDGFRFDLAPVLGRPGGRQFDQAATLLTAIAADPVLQTRKLIAEPWDATAEGYALGRFGADWAEWNDRFRGSIRDFWRGTGGVRDLGYRLAGSEDFFASRAPWASINFITAHDGFTLRDLVSYEQKHNDANGQDGTDGTNDNRSANYGMEGDGTAETPVSADIVALRTRQARNMAATLLLATGTPMICAGDEIWRTQHGNNNAYSIDSAEVWLDWSVLDSEMSPGTDTGMTPPPSPAAELLSFFSRVIALRAAAPALHQGNFFSGRSPMDGDGVADLKWFTETGAPMGDGAWFDNSRRTLMVWFDGNDVRSHGPHGERLTDDSWLIVLHAADTDTTITLPGVPYGDQYTPVLDTAQPTGLPASTAPIRCGLQIAMPARTVWLLRAHRPPAGA
ncbi:MAG: glycogen debranching protein GlgX [Nakamurella sp.]